MNGQFQYYVYDADSFIADVGGYLGLLLGQSVYGIYEIIMKWLRYKMKWCKEISSIKIT